MDLLLSIGFWLVATLHGGGLIAFAILMAARGMVHDGRSENVVRVLRAWGPGHGLSLGALIFFGALQFFLAHDGFTWPVVEDADRLTAAAHIVFLVYWASSFHLEIWTLQPSRTHDDGTKVTDRTAYETCATRATAQQWVNVLLFVLAGGLLVAAGAA
ncbi:MAG: hypothetical protein GY913_19540 [Proteobacteria bacterium]|nr:hypothetical protein [Pseudomonadota bacterium]